jgi:site-specific DNA-methyltransferase (adenine-specific)
LKKHQNPKIAILINSLFEFMRDTPMMAYLVNMTARLVPLHRVLKSTGSLYLHCDPTASHYLKIILDVIFGKKNFRNEIVWCYGSGGASTKRFSKKHDVLLFYTKTKEDDYTFNVDAVREPYSSPHKSMTPKIVGDKSYIKMNPLGRIPFDWWQIPILTNSAKERLGYPTQKPEALLERIIKASK